MMEKVRVSAALVLLLSAFSGGVAALGDNVQLQARVAQIKSAIAANKQMLAQYTWQQFETISVKGDIKKQETYQVLIGPDGQQQKAPESEQSQSGRQREHGIKHHMTEEYENYGKAIAALAQSYAQPDPGKIQYVYQQGQVTLGSAGAPNTAAIVIHNYVKQGDSVTLVFNTALKAMLAANVATYLSDPSDAVTIAAQFAQLSDGTNYVQNLTINGSSKSLTVQESNSNFQKR